MQVLTLKRALGNKKGVSIFIVLMFMIVASLLGTAMMFMSRKGAEMQGDYYHMKMAEESAESAINWFRGFVLDYNEGDGDADILDWMENFVDEQYLVNASGEWSQRFGSENPLQIDLGINSSAQIEVVHVDFNRSLVTIEVVGFGMDGAKKTLNAVYRLVGKQSFVDLNVDFDEIRSKTLTNLSESQMIIDSDVEVEGGIYSKGDVRINNGVVVEGDVHVMGNLIVNGNAEIRGNIYVHGETTFSGAASIGTGPDAEFAFFNDNLTNSNGNITIGTNAYFAAGHTGVNATINVDGDTYFRGEAFDFVNTSGTEYTHENMQEVKEAHLDEKDYTEISEQDQVTLNLDRIRENVNVNTSDMFGDGVVSEGLDADLINQLYNEGSVEIDGEVITFDDDDKAANNGALVLRVDNQINDGAWEGQLDAGVNVMLLIDETVSSSGKLWGSTIGDPPNNFNSSSLGIAIGEGEIQNLGTGDNPLELRNFRGVYYTEKNPGPMREFVDSRGAIIVNNKEHSGDYQVHSESNVEYDEQALQAFFNFIDIGDDPFFDPEEVIEENVSTSSLYPQLLTKY